VGDKWIGRSHEQVQQSYYELIDPATTAELDTKRRIGSRVIMDLLIQKIRSLHAYRRLLADLTSRKQLQGLALPRAGRLPLLACLHEDISQPIVFITDRADHALQLYTELSFWAPGVPRFHFSEPNPLFYENAAWGNTTRRERLETLTTLSAYHLPFIEKPSTPPIIIMTVRALMTRTLPRRDFLKACKKLIAGQSIIPVNLLQNWVSIGYLPADTVLEPGQFSHRGGLLDIWPLTESNPIRLELFGNEIDTLRVFNPVTQRTIGQIDYVVVAPARELITRNDTDSSTEITKYEYPQLPEQASEFLIPVVHPIQASILDYLPPKTLVLMDDLNLLESTGSEIEEEALQLRAESIVEGTLAHDFPVPYISWSELSDQLQSFINLELGFSTAEEPGSSLSVHFSQIERFGGRLKPFIEYLVKIVTEGNSVTIVSRQSTRLEELWAEEWRGGQVGQGDQASLQFIEASLSEGFQLQIIDSMGSHLLITDSEIFGWERPQLRQHPRPAVENPEAIYADLKPGDWIVHVDYGIGRFTGLVKRKLEGLEREFLCLEYKHGDQVFVPIHQADRLTRYIGPEGYSPVPGSLETQEWSEAKRKVHEAVKEVAQDLLALYASRQVVKGFAFSADSPWQGELESSFPYVETGDQVRALHEIKSDMETPRPMDRLLCGDVGYGKTEVALRAAFKAVMDGRQVAVLVPTTVLAQQHYDTFRQRLSAFPVTVEMLSRFRTPREQDQILNALSQGAVDIVIGTHRLISADVQFRNLGLVIIDEEQRFGVTHKEHLKRLRTEVDVLTLTATPIPRTLYMALTGVRDISNLNTPPEERLPIITHVGPYSPRLVRQSILRELERGGQVFFVHNRVQTIDAMRMHLEKLVPEAHIAIGHGQMPEIELASVMHRFTAGEIDILLSTSIIESGLDIPNANTLIVDRADAFGLAQLYQLRGRVGRGGARAYAYFFRHNKLAPTPEGQERLEIIAENTQLGAGYSIAMRDLEMRGAGELLGTRQSGYIAAVGFHLFTRLLAAAVKQARTTNSLAGQGRDFIPASLESLQPMAMPVNVDLPLAIGIPDTYIPDTNLRLRLYRRIADLTDKAYLDALADEFSDRFGPLPEMVINLFYQMQIKLLAEAAGLASISMESGQIVLRYPPLPDQAHPKHLQDLGSGIRGGKSAYWCQFGKEPDWQARLVDVLGKLKKNNADG
jgi:transcription-repair coupling factor (superfamily II helicase)